MIVGTIWVMLCYGMSCGAESPIPIEKPFGTVDECLKTGNYVATAARMPSQYSWRVNCRPR
jgi:hypothetical protein